MFKRLGNILTQGFPPKPTFTENNLGDLSGKVVVVTGGYSGVGYQLSKILYAKNAVVYIAGRREDAGQDAIKSIKEAYPDSKGRLEFLLLDLADLSTIKASANAFLEKETRLDVLFNNAGIMRLPKKAPTRSKQDHEIMLAVNCFGPFLFTRLLHPVIESTAKSSPAGSVRVVWLGSLMIQLMAPKGGIDLDNLDYKKKWLDEYTRYSASKSGNLFISSEWARRDAGNGILHLTVNPGNLKTPLQRDVSPLEYYSMLPVLHDPIYGAYSELFAGLSPDVKPEHSGQYVMPWGRFGPTRPDIDKSLSPQNGEDTSNAGKFFEYCENQTKSFA
ncbi:uncharacterized protein TrAFT101_007882 [Trichoderma asperellum]|uniref:NAD(P)-binding protein n=1 Tax=Trichoderma asperellum (strain ATCC 204424 / CBS 433.97 / NBRC 101777) TaxID=1042311 RepID=A0A2T3Z3F4_TRIA4|nr:hypothetical protein M441DRAFT_59379 [Trichoderma asperellum CBS 433.97]PTB39322.1 hypothetical protein M441DRAFT_59379 [Trichoderma asperellum CBS 433.97]UKZ92951.1 hypothetical protein TrAFT101_007882 [Trichoderma asperellum]